MERAEDVKKPIDGERASRPEKPTSKERAMRREKPNHEERAIPGEKPNKYERAIVSEKPRAGERATSREKSKPQERPPPDGGEPRWSPIRNLVDSYYDIQRLRIAIGLRLSRSPEEMAADEHETLLFSLHRDLEKNERAFYRHLGEVAERHPLGTWLTEHRGIGPVLAANLLSTFDPERAPHVSSYWSFAGMYPGARLRKGEKAKFSRQAKTLAWKIATSFLKSRNEGYRKIYDQAKKKYLDREWTKGHAHNAALRIVAKEFLRHFWVVSREAVDLPTDEPYVIAVLGHTKRISMGGA